MRKKTVEIFAICGTCDRGDRKSFMAKGELYCKLTSRRVHTNAICPEYKHAGSTLVQIERRARDGRAQLVMQTELAL